MLLVKQQGSKFENIISFILSSNKFLFTLGFNLFEGNWLAIDDNNFEFVKANSHKKSHKTAFAEVTNTAANCVVHVKQEN